MHVYVSLNTGYCLVIGLTGGSKKLRFTQITQVHALNSSPLHVKQVQVSKYGSFKLLNIFQQRVIMYGYYLITIQYYIGY